MVYNKIQSTLPILFFFIALLFSPNFSLSAQAEEESFDAGEYIMDHITDDYGWHITTYNEHHVTIPLPVMLFDGGEFVVFSSGKFHHGHQAYKGYALGFTEETDGAIVKLGGNYADYTGEIDYASAPVIDHVCKYDVSITKNVCALLISIILLCWIFLSIAKKYKEGPLKAPKGMQSLMEPLILFIRDEVVIPSIGEDKYQKYFPYLLTLFFFILINNLMGIPFSSPTFQPTNITGRTSSTHRVCPGG